MKDTASQDDTIVAVATPPGRGAIGIIRISGPAAISMAGRIFHGSKDPANMHTYTFSHGWIEEEGEVIDEALCLVMRAPSSYTREDTVELHCHGGPASLHRVLEAVRRQGARLADPGEFTRRAFLSGRIDLTRSEAVADLVAGDTEASARAAVRQLEGMLSNRLEELRTRLLDLLALLEASVDFSDEEDVPPLKKEEIIERLADADSRLADLLQAAGRGKLLREGANLVIAGRPNVGKSTLMNALLRKERVIVSPTPGTTRDVVEEALDIGGVPVRMLDTAGISSQAKDIEKMGVDRAFTALSEADLLIVMMDASKPLSEDDRLIAQMVRAPAVLALNKCDLETAVPDEEARQLLPGVPLVRISALQGTGLPELEEELSKMLMNTGTESPLVTSARHEDALLRTRQSLQRAADSAGRSEEFIASDVRQAIEALGEITGESATDEVLDRIFSRFCVGK